MKVNLCIDWGNSRVKAALFKNGDVLMELNCDHDEITSKIMSLVGEYQPHASILCAVSEVSAELIDFLKAKTSFFFLDDSMQLPIINAYHTHKTLGMDRVAMSVGMQEAFPNGNNLAIGVGTAITYNFVQKNGIFRGGNISPGLALRFRALHEFTDKLPLVSEKGETLLLGYDTQTCIRSGVILGMAAEIDGMINNYRAQYPDFNAVLTGGDAAFFADKLKNKTFVDSRLLLTGLNSILNYNAR